MIFNFESVAEVNNRLIDNSSENLIPFPYYRPISYTTNGVTFTYGNDGIIYANGTATADVYYDVKIRNNDMFQLKVGKKYVASGVTGGDTTTYYMYIPLRNSADSSLLNVLIQNNPIEFTVPNNTARAGVTIKIASGQTLTNVAFKPMIVPVREDGSYATVYQRNYDTNRELTDRLTQNGYGELSGGRNLIPFPYEGAVNENGISYTVNVDGSVSASGATNGGGNSYFYLCRDLPIKAGTYSFSDNVANNSYEQIRILIGSTSYWSSVTKQFTVSADTTISYVALVTGGTSTHNLTYKPMLEEGTVAHAYEPYYESNKVLTDKSNDLIELKYLGWTTPKEYTGPRNYQSNDGIFHKVVERVNLGALTWNTQATTDGTGIRFYASLNPEGKHPKDGNTKANIYCSKYVTGTNSDTASKVKCIAYHQTANLLSVYDPAYTDAVSFRSAMSRVYLYYEVGNGIYTAHDGQEIAETLANVINSKTFSVTTDSTGTATLDISTTGLVSCAYIPVFARSNISTGDAVYIAFGVPQNSNRNYTCKVTQGDAPYVGTFSMTLFYINYLY